MNFNVGILYEPASVTVDEFTAVLDRIKKAKIKYKVTRGGVFLFGTVVLEAIRKGKAGVIIADLES
jgi:ethanolamine ammonia-lyase large subunit